VFPFDLLKSLIHLLKILVSFIGAVVRNITRHICIFLITYKFISKISKPNFTLNILHLSSKIQERGKTALKVINTRNHIK